MSNEASIQSIQNDRKYDEAVLEDVRKKADIQAIFWTDLICNLKIKTPKNLEFWIVADTESAILKIKGIKQKKDEEQEQNI